MERHSANTYCLACMHTYSMKNNTKQLKTTTSMFPLAYIIDFFFYLFKKKQQQQQKT